MVMLLFMLFILFKGWWWGRESIHVPYRHNSLRLAFFNLRLDESKDAEPIKWDRAWHCIFGGDHKPYFTTGPPQTSLICSALRVSSFKVLYPPVLTLGSKISSLVFFVKERWLNGGLREGIPGIGENADLPFFQLSESTGVGALPCVRTAHCLVLCTPEDPLPHGGHWWRQETSSHWLPEHPEMSGVTHEVEDCFCLLEENVSVWLELEFHPGL